MTASQVRIAVVGAAGRMGREIVQACHRSDGVYLSAAVERAGSPFLGLDAGELAGLSQIGVPIDADLAAACRSSDVLIDFSLAEAVEQVARLALSSETPLVSGTTGLPQAAQTALKEASQTIPVLAAPNLSPGVAVLTALVEQAARQLGEQYDIEIIETHHRGKVDAPSGTALALAEKAAHARGIPFPAQLCFGRNGRTGERPVQEIGIHSVRGGGVFGEHSIVLTGQNEQISISHKAFSRAVFADGALRAALFVANAPAGLYSMADLL